jgi:hypothetical protein
LTARADIQIFNHSLTENLTLTSVGASPRMGVFGAAAVAKPVITGSRGGNAALASLLTQGATVGYWTDSTTA